MPPVPSPETALTEYLSALQAALQPPTNQAASLPGPSDLTFHRTLNRQLPSIIQDTSISIHTLLNRLLIATGGIEEGEELDEAAIDSDRLPGVIDDVVDKLLERADKCLDEFNGLRPFSQFQARSSQLAAGKGIEDDEFGDGPLPPHILNANISPLPQSKWAKPDNSRDAPWHHTLKHKPHALVPLEETPQPVAGAPIQPPRAGMYCAEGRPEENPYFHEIHAFKVPGHALEVPAEPKPPPPINGKDPAKDLTFVDSLEKLEALKAHLEENRVEEIAIDVEHHNYRSYQGLVSLVQLSTRWGDYIIDPLVPEVRAQCHRLNTAFANPSKVKVLHGAEHDVLWLQRDLSLYLVGLFDTYHASVALGLRQKSLAFLLDRYTGFTADKRWQLADWRIRPLPRQMLYYARADTHALLYVYDAMRTELAQAEVEGIPVLGKKDNIVNVFERSKQTAARTFAKEVWDPAGEGREGWQALWLKHGGLEAANVTERYAKGGADGLARTERLVRRLHDWRDRAAREEDESPRYVLSAVHLVNIASRALSTAQDVTSAIGRGLKHRSADIAREVRAELFQYQEAQLAKEAKERAKLAAGADAEEELAHEPSESRAGPHWLFGHRSHSDESASVGPVKGLPSQSPTSGLAGSDQSQRIKASFGSVLARLLGGGKATAAQTTSDQLVPSASTDAAPQSNERINGANPVESISVERVELPASHEQSALQSGAQGSSRGASSYDDDSLGDIVQVSKKKKTKAKWSTEQKAAAKRAREESASEEAVELEALAKLNGRGQTSGAASMRKPKTEFKAFDYDNAVSVLDAPRPKETGLHQVDW
ncbi:Exosome 3'-5' exoribonuclease complex, subunit PM/SCL-100 (Rrp6) [Ceraceosorus bombacis]|uniref:Exosome 3'-5' exoribonuclease complex, subunit PM/SCL-100 (Rrp6) n=1 Tax=Ceraceosorus bombacis TaxID=401625 RepID=A0A0N7LAB1_9BASI|nr:Exosome 3'-5' exoribonuclease complex, subunit PM/SCL-100 (Rrp6) [Ceraceosorus bombacis]